MADIGPLDLSGLGQEGQGGHPWPENPAWSAVGTRMKLALHGSSLTLKGSVREVGRDPPSADRPGPDGGDGGVRSSDSTCKSRKSLSFCSR